MFRHVEYRPHLLDHLLTVKLRHWDKSIRELSARALYRFTEYEPDHMATKVLPSLVCDKNKFIGCVFVFVFVFVFFCGSAFVLDVATPEH
jgi:hypothetical protein